MVEPSNNFEWAKKLECPPAACTNPVKKILCKGILELLWSEIGNAALTNKEIREVRKNILLYKLKHGLKDLNIDCIKNIEHLKAERRRLKTIASSLKTEYEEKDFLIRQKVEQLKNIKSKRYPIQVKKSLLEIRHNEIRTQLRNCDDMRLVCQSLMPKTSEDLSKDMLKESLSAITILNFGATKREVKDKIFSLIGHIKVPTLWTHLYQGFCQDVDNLIKFKTAISSENLAKEYVNTDGEDIDIGIARLSSQCICNVSRMVCSQQKANEYEEEAMMTLENIETSISNNDSLSEWLSLSLEVRKLEIEDKVLQNEIKNIQLECDNDISAFEFQQSLSELRDIDSEMEKCVNSIHQSLPLLKSAESTIIRLRDKLNDACSNLLALQSEDYNSEWLNTDLNAELNIFYEKLDINALRKILLQRAFRYEAYTMEKASVVLNPLNVSNIMPYFPMIQAPIYCLIECYKHFMVNYAYQNIETLSTVKDCAMPIFVAFENDYDTMELLMLTEQNCNETKKEIDAFNVTLTAWDDQTVQNAMTLVEKTVDDLSFPEWIKRYNLLLYMIESANK